MTIFRKPRVLTLPEWLEIATRKLSQPAKDRIRLEIEAHYAEAVEAHRENGLSESAAQTSALAELGDAKDAGKRFRKQHITEREAQTLKTADKTSRKISLLLLSYFMFGAFTFDQLSLPRNSLTHYRYLPLYLSLELLILVALPTICFLVARLGRAKRHRHLLLLQPISGVIPGFLLSDLLLKPASYDFTHLFGISYWLLAYWLLATVVILSHFRLWLKLGKTGAVSDPPPPDTAQV